MLKIDVRVLAERCITDHRRNVRSVDVSEDVRIESSPAPDRNSHIPLDEHALPLLCSIAVCGVPAELRIESRAKDNVGVRLARSHAFTRRTVRCLRPRSVLLNRLVGSAR